MINKRIVLEDNKDVYITTYVLDSIKKDERKPAIVICPGGAYIAVSPIEKECVATKFNSNGYHAFTLDYSTSSTAKNNSKFPQQLMELAKTIKLIKENAEEWKVDITKISIIGFSAGANLAANYGVYWNKPLLKTVDEDSEKLRVNAVVLCYPLIDYELNYEILNKKNDKDVEMVRVTGTSDKKFSALDLIKNSNKIFLGTENPTKEEMRMVSPMYHISSDTPPTFIWHTFEDELVTVQQSLKYASKMHEWNIPCELHVYERGHHGLSLADETSATKSSNINENVSTWFQLAINWLKLR